jgi:hypothetical protein
MYSGSLDVLSDDVPTHHMLGDDVRCALSIHMIIQCRRTPGTR